MAAHEGGYRPRVAPRRPRFSPRGRRPRWPLPWGSAIWWRCHLPLHLYKGNPWPPCLIHPHLLSSLAWLPRLELCPRARGNSTLRTLSHWWISGLSSSSSVASLDWILYDVYTPYVCNTAEVLPLEELRSAWLTPSTMFMRNVFPLSVFKGMNTAIAPLPYNYIEEIMGKVCRNFFCFLLWTPTKTSLPLSHIASLPTLSLTHRPFWQNPTSHATAPPRGWLRSRTRWPAHRPLPT
jgi:hypothetical protein